jgi:transcriptional regulator with XRE-family HTH domain
VISLIKNMNLGGFQMKLRITLRVAREIKLLSIKDASEKSGISVSTIKRWEKDCRKADVFKLMKLLNVYRVSFDRIYCGKEENAHEQYVSAVRNGTIRSFFNSAIQHAIDNEIPTHNVREVKRLMGVAIKENMVCCGQPVNVRGVHDVETDRHSLLVTCNQCRFHREYIADKDSNYQEGATAIEDAVKQLKAQGYDESEVRGYLENIRSPRVRDLIQTQLGL